MFTTYLVLEERVSDIFHHSGHGQNVILAFLISMHADSIADRGALVPNHPESAMRELAQLRGGIDCDNQLEQIFPSLILAVTLQCVAIAFRTQPV